MFASCIIKLSECTRWLTMSCQKFISMYCFSAVRIKLFTPYVFDNVGIFGIAFNCFVQFRQSCSIWEYVLCYHCTFVKLSHVIYNFPNYFISASQKLLVAYLIVHTQGVLEMPPTQLARPLLITHLDKILFLCHPKPCGSCRQPCLSSAMCKVICQPATWWDASATPSPEIYNINMV